MKKITTSGRSFGTAQSLTRQQLKNVMGGSAPSEPSTCTVSTDCAFRKTTATSASGSISCTGKKCSRSGGVSVTCDGTVTYC